MMGVAAILRVNILKSAKIFGLKLWRSSAPRNTSIVGLALNAFAVSYGWPSMLTISSETSWQFEEMPVSVMGERRVFSQARFMSKSRLAAA
mmetsp:Transcript_97/g.267  ORF Transcript_97/g.267 Transcript_97/m.267 type:complete len:91 (-) Transcript_97:273-545(-)